MLGLRPGTCCYEVLQMKDSNLVGRCQDRPITTLGRSDLRIIHTPISTKPASNIVLIHNETSIPLAVLGTFKYEILQHFGLAWIVHGIARHALILEFYRMKLAFCAS